MRTNCAKEVAHAATLLRKQQRIAGLSDLLAAHEQANQPDHDYIREVKRRLHAAEQQLRVMAS
jgi:hypothetical protein